MIQALGIAKHVVHSLERQMNSRSNVEVCGLLAGAIENTRTAVALVAVPLPNLSERDESFAIDPAAFMRAKVAVKRKGHTVLALYHSHPSGLTRPSSRDLQLPRITRLLGVILAQTEDRVYAACYEYEKGRIRPVEVIAPYPID